MAQFANINRVYKTVKYFLDKNGHGYYKVDTFNTFAPLAQRDLFIELLDEYTRAKSSRASRIRGKAGNDRSFVDIQQDLRPLHVSFSSLTSPTANNVFDYPDDYEYYTQLSTAYTPCEVISSDDADFPYIMSSQLAEPSEKFPVALMTDRTINILPSSVTAAELSYYKTPQGSDVSGNKSTQQPTWAYTIPVGTNIEAYNPTASINFELPSNVEHRLAWRILEYFGVNLREKEVENYAMVKQQQQDQKEMI